MRALLFDDYGPPDVLHIGRVERPLPGPGQVRIRVRAAAVNPVDWKIRSGASAAFHRLSLPHIPGLDAAGVVDEVGPGVTGLHVGDEIFGSTVTGASAEYALLDATAWAYRPAGLSWAEAAALPSAAETGLRAVDLLGVADGDTVLVNGAAGAVGLAAAQFAMARGASVIGTAGDHNHDFLAGLGITPTRYGAGLVHRVRAWTPGVNRALNAAGQGALPDLIALTGAVERVITVVAEPAAAELGVRFTTGAERRYWEALQLAVDLHEKGRFTLPVQHVFPLADGAEAHRRSEHGHGLGKLVLQP
ncbi:NADPH:quinone reductase [Paractinoplanes tereljensis]|uniref:NADPH:quinone reductase n=1 Tax=Paractinoplanes tereljensis TaxID=571912 RepID=A0A919NWW1_9ACTN|nr:NADP-dependent oxidoreductase [Actinoplanes tereljensis]GIF26725.1 NADPH:quinone reductase [Actinoplanes tereljensis]